MSIGTPIGEQEANWGMRVEDTKLTLWMSAVLGTYTPIVALMGFLSLWFQSHQDAITQGSIDAILVLSAWFAWLCCCIGKPRRAACVLYGAMYCYFLVQSVYLGPLQSLTLLPVILMAYGGKIYGRYALWAVLIAVALTQPLASLTTQVRGLPMESWRTIAPYGIKIFAAFVVAAVVFDRIIIALRDAVIALEHDRCKLRQIEVQLRQEIASHRTSQDRLLKAYKLEAVSRVAIGLAHDFRGLLSIIVAHAGQREELLDRGAKAVSAAFDDIESAASRAEALAGRLLDFSRWDGTLVQPFHIPRTLRDLMPLMRRIAGNGIRIETNFDCENQNLMLIAHRDQFELALLNLIANSRDAMLGQGDVICSCFETSESIIVSVTDTGPGVAQDVIKRVLEPFFTTKSQGSGTGLGLALVDHFSRSVGGTTIVSSSLGDGTTVRLEFPRYPPERV